MNTIGMKIDEATVKGKGLVEKAGEKLVEAGHAVKQLATKVVHAAEESAEKVAHTAQETKHEAEHRGQEVLQKATDKAKQ